MLVEGVRDYAIVILNEDGTIALWNSGAESLTGYAADEVLGKSVRMLYGEHAAEMSVLLDQARQSGRADTEGLRRRKDGSTFWANTIITCMFSDPAKEHLIGYCEITHDLTERKKHEQNLRDMNVNLERLVKERTADLEAANKELEAFSYSVSHDLRAPLRSIDGFAKILLEDFAPKLDADIVRNLEIISRNAIKMGALIDDLLTFSKLNRAPISACEIDMDKLVRQVKDEFLSEKMDDRKINFTLLRMPTAYGDRAMLKQVVVNLISNAVKFTAQEDVAQIEVGSFSKDQSTVFYVKDNGVGFDMKYIGKLFAPFQRLHKSKDFPGTGIGLALVQRIVHRHGGAVWIQSEPNKGTTVYFTLQTPEEYATR